MSRAELAVVAGLTRRYVHELEAGKRTMHLDRIVSALDAVGLELVVRRRTTALGQEPPHDEDAPDW
jgi:transcriptional regulator with XRE-family HTH domain